MRILNRYSKIDEMEAGADMNWRVAVGVLGRRVTEESAFGPAGQRYARKPTHHLPDEWLKDYSGDAGAAMEVARHLRETGWLVVIKWMPKEAYYIIQGDYSEYGGSGEDTRGFKGKTLVDINWMHKYEGRLLPFSLTSPTMSSADELPLAVCRAGLKAAVAMVELEKGSWLGQKDE